MKDEGDFDGNFVDNLNSCYYKSKPLKINRSGKKVFRERYIFKQHKKKDAYYSNFQN